MGCVQSTSKDVKFKDAAAQIQLDRTSFTLVNKNEFGAIKNSDSLKKLPDITNNDLKENAYETKIINGSHKKHRRCESTQSHSKQRRKPPFVRDKFDPRVLQKYEVKALIGRGSFSKVVRVENRKTKQPYAIKMIEIHPGAGRELFHAEVSVLQRVRHENIVKLYEVLETRDRSYLVMELATGGELFDRIVARGHFTEADATRCLKMVLEGVLYLHKLGITHRDLKPENLLFYHPGHDSKIIITDFGLSCSRKSGQNQLMRTTCGTPEYIAPEILMRKPYTNAVDLWAIGVITYILLSGTMPFDDDNKTRLYRTIIRAHYNFRGSCWEDVSSDAKDFIRKLLVVNSDIRLKSEEALRHSWIQSGALNAANKNLHRTISQNLMERASSRGTRSSKSNKSNRSKMTNKSGGANSSQRSSQRSIRPVTHRITPNDVHEIDVIRRSCSTFSPSSDE
ncbi:serine/threonine-protein kinase H1 homolog [Convolutriloba macropyga]|uniref:serine/threonine-protein kinase H1 homolog n=1 Tax=Convolutriloba macropyga TaxID=536237 RepID=UPI003F524B91